MVRHDCLLLCITEIRLLTYFTYNRKLANKGGVSELIPSERTAFRAVGHLTPWSLADSSTKYSLSDKHLRVLSLGQNSTPGRSASLKADDRL